MRNRTDQNTPAEEILILHSKCFFIKPIVKHQSTHHRAVPQRSIRSCRVYIRHQPVAQVNRRLDRIIIYSSLFAEIPRFAPDIRTMAAKNGEKYAKLEPARQQFLISRIIRRILKVAVPEPLRTLFDKECAYIERPERQTACAEVQACRDLLSERFPFGRYVSRPQDCAETLTAGMSTARQITHTVCIRFTAHSVIDRLRVHQGVCVNAVTRDKL